MAIVKTVEIDGREVPFRASAAVPRMYRAKFKRDIYRDITALEAVFSSQEEGTSTLDGASLEVFENLAYIMAKHADPAVPNTPEEWLEEFNTFSIYLVLPELLSLWADNMQTSVPAKKK